MSISTSIAALSARRRLRPRGASAESGRSGRRENRRPNRPPDIGGRLPGPKRGSSRLGPAGAKENELRRELAELLRCRLLPDGANGLRDRDLSREERSS